MRDFYDPLKPERAIVGLCYTSNPEAREVQDVVLADGRQYWELIAECIRHWAWEIGVCDNAGLVMAAAYEKVKGSGEVFTEHLTRCRGIVGNDLWFLIPGVGAQGGFAQATVRAAYTTPGSIAVNSSSDIIFASSEKDYADAAAHKTAMLRDDMRAVMTVSAVHTSSV